MGITPLGPYTMVLTNLFMKEFECVQNILRTNGPAFRKLVVNCPVDQSPFDYSEWAPLSA